MDVGIQEIIEVLRNDRPVIWVGAGFSKVAGLPCAKELAKKICSAIGERRKVEACDLPIVASKYEHKFSRTNLDELIVSSLSEEPISLEYHKALMNIPQIEDIITTNYDTLLEKSNSLKKLNVIRGYKERINLLTGFAPQINLYKIHGCITQPGSMIITSEDYSKMDSEIAATPIFQKVFSLVCERKVLILGYSFRDAKLFELLEHSGHWINTQQQVKYCIDISINPTLLKKLESANIKGIRGDIREIAQQLYQKTTEDVARDAMTGIIPLSFATKAIQGQGFIPEWQSRGEGAIIKTLTPINGAQLKGHFEIKAGSPSVEKMQRILRSETAEPILIPDTDIVRTSLKAGLVELLSDKISLIKIAPLPAITSIVDILSDGKTIFTSINMDIFQSRTQPTMKIFNSDFELQLIMGIENGKFQINYSICDKCDLVAVKSLAILLKDMVSSKKISIHSSDGKICFDLPSIKMYETSTCELVFLSTVDMLYEVASTLIELQAYCHSRITFPLEISKEEFSILNSIRNSHDMVSTINDRYEIQMTLEDCDVDTLIRDRLEKVSFRLYSTERKKVRVIGQEFDLGHHVLCASDIPVEETVAWDRLNDRSMRIRFIVQGSCGRLCSFYTKNPEDSIVLIPAKE